MTPDDSNGRPPYTYLRKGRWFWEPPPRLRGPSHKTVALGSDQATAWTVARGLNRELSGNPTKGLPGTVRWLFSQFEATSRFDQLDTDGKVDSTGTLAAKTQKDYRWLGRLLSAHVLANVPLGTVPARALKARHADKIHGAVKEKHGAAAAHYACRYARRVWNWARRQEHVADNPWAGMELATLAARKQRWTREQVEAFCAKAVQKGWPSQSLGVRLGYWLGMREGDIIALTWTALDSRSVETSKTGAEVPASASAYPDLRKALRLTPRAGVQVLICETTGRPWSEDYFRHVFRDIARAAELPDDLQYRDLRATAATELSDAGADVIALSTHTGHLTTEMARRYARRTPEQFEAAAKLRVAAERRAKRKAKGNT